MNLRCLFALLLLLLTTAAAPAAPPPANPAKRAVTNPRLDVYVYRRSYTPAEKVQVRLSGFNISAVQFAAYRLDLGRIVTRSGALEDFGKTLKTIDIAGRTPATVWRFPMGQIYPDQWAERAVTLPKLAPGVYLIQARAGGAEKRTWLAVTNVALLAKRSRQELLVYAAQADTGRPVTHLPLALVDAHGAWRRGATDEDGLLRVPTDGAQGSLWINGTGAGGPAFALTDEPATPDPFTVYTLTDRPLYRPGHIVRYKSIVRQRVEAQAPGGFSYRPYGNRPATVEIRDATDALVARRTVTTTATGSLSGDFALAAEPALGNWHLNVILGDYHAYSGFTVEAYRKPEMTATVMFDRAHYLGGGTVPVTVEARYYFGQPVANASVRYSLTFAGVAAEPPFQGQGVTDAQGQLHLQVQTQRLPSDRTLSVQATVTDLSRRSQSAEGSALLTAGQFRLSLGTDQGSYKPGKRITVNVRAVDYDSRPVAVPVRARMIETKEDDKHRPYEETATRDIATDASGRGVAFFSSPRPGTLRLTAEAFDGEKNKIAAEGSVWIADPREVVYSAPTCPTLGLDAAQSSFHPGEVAGIRLNSSLVGRPFVAATKTSPAQPARPDAWALVTVEGERLGRQQVVHLTRKTTELHVALSADDFPSVSVNVAIIQDHQVYEQQQRLSVERKDQKLTVAVTSDKPRYAPGETATYTVTTRDYLGRPVPADVSLGVVDASLYAIQPDSAPEMESFFYSGQEVRVQTDFSFAAQYSGGGYQTVPGAAAGGAGGIRVRRLFADTAYWNPNVETDATGAARVSFTVPDNLTTWRATAHGATAQTAVGSATAEAVAAVLLLVRLELPRFYIQGDQAVVSAIVQNYTGTARTVQAHVEAHGATLTGDAQRTLSLPAGGSVRMDWRAKIADPAGVRFLVTADGGPGGQDATESALPVRPDGLKRVTATAETLTDPKAQSKLALADLPPGATVTLTLAPSLAAAAFDAVDWLAAAPDGTAEETTSAFLSDIAVARALRLMHSGRPVRPDLNGYVSLGLQKLYRYQHADGGWNWWEFDQTDGDMTAYVLSGLVQARDAGYLVDDQRVLRGTAALERLLGGQQELGRRADWLLTLAAAAPADAAKPLMDLFADRDKLDTYGQASLCLALARVGGPKPAALAATVAAALAAKAGVQGRTAYWSATQGGYSWRDDDIGVTAHALRALLTATPDSPLVPAAVRWLMANRDGNAWDSTRSTAEAVFALAQYMGRTGELQPDFTANVLLDGQSVESLMATPQTVFDAPLSVTLTPDQLRGHTALTVDKQGGGALYLSRTVSFLVPPAQATAQSHGITVRRLYRVSAEDPSRADTVASGSDIDVTLDVTADADYRYARLEAPIPAGCEVEAQSNDDGSFPLDYCEGNAGYAREETRDDKVVFFFDALPKGHTRLTYRLHAETPGVYHILPDIASLAYFPEVRGNSGLATAQIGERP